MCGILVEINYRNPVDRENFARAGETLKHRGPDAEGSLFVKNGRVALGHRRLSILDPDERANQPMSAGGVHVVYNGEIYNFPELREKLESRGRVFRTNCDTEVLLHGYLEWGRGLLDELRGMFAFVIADEEKGEFLAARDRSGQKPLYYISDGEATIFASEISAIRKIRKNPTVDEEALLDSLFYGYVPPPKTAWKEIRALRHGCFMSGKLDEFEAPEQGSYWSFVPPKDPERGEMDALFYDRLEKAVKRHLQSDVPVGLLLSGGLDSTAIAIMLQKMGVRLKAFSMTFPGSGHDESHRVRDTAGALDLDIDFVEFRKQRPGELPGFFNEVYGQPYFDPSAPPFFQICRKAAESRKVLIGGDGGDELLAGYPQYYDRLKKPGLLSRALGKKLEVPRIERLEDVRLHALFTPGEFLNLLGPSGREIAEGRDLLWHYREYWHPELDSVRAMQWLDVNTFLACQLNEKADRGSMASSVEYRTPFEDDDLREFVFSRHPLDYAERGRTKRILRDLFADSMAESVRAGAKRGFAAPNESLGVNQINVSALVEEGYVAESGLENGAWRFRCGILEGFLERND